MHKSFFIFMQVICCCMSISAVGQINIGNVLRVTVYPKDAYLYIDDRLQQNERKGEYHVFLNYGIHTYRVEAIGFAQQKGNLTIDSDSTILNIILESNLSSLTITCPTKDALIYLNNQFKGTQTWTGTVTPGKYLIEAKKNGYSKTVENVYVGKSENKNLTLAALLPIYGMLKVNIMPVGATVFIDGKEVGLSPIIVNNIQIGEHIIMAKDSLGNELTKLLTIKENEILSINDIIPNYTADQLWDKILNSSKSGDCEDFFRCSFILANMDDARGYWALSKGFAIAAGLTESPDTTLYSKTVVEKYGITNITSEAYKYLVKAAEKNHPYALCMLADVNIQSENKEKQTLAVLQYTKAAEFDFHYAQYELAICYLKGLGCEKNEGKAIALLEKAAQGNYSYAQNLLADYYFKGEYVTCDKLKANKLRLSAAEQGLTAAQYEYAQCLVEGDGVKQNVNLAIEWLNKAASKNDAKSINLLGIIYFCGLNGEINKEKAFEYYKKAADLGFAPAQYHVAECYLHGEGTSVDRNKAKCYYLKSADGGSDRAKERLKLYFKD